jgi:hypothetical protein
MTIKTHKAAANSITDVDLGKRTAVTAFATYGSLDRDKDRAHKGMFTKSWQEFTDVITDSSYYFLPTKYAKNEAGGYNFTEVFMKEVSVLTHWGAHPESKIVSVQKAASDVEIGEAILKQLNTSEIDFLRQFIGSLNGNLLTLATFSAGLSETSDIYSWTNSVLTDLSYTIARFKERLIWGQKCWSPDELSERLARLKSFCKNTTASDETIKLVLKEAEDIETFLMMEATPQPAQVEEQAKSSDDVGLALLNIKMLLNQ